MLCPCCGSTGFYEGFTSRDCRNPECTLYPKNKKEDMERAKRRRQEQLEPPIIDEPIPNKEPQDAFETLHPFI